MRRVLLLADSDSPHTLKWAKSIISKNFEVGIFSIHTPDNKLYNDCPKISLFSVNVSRELQTKTEKSISKFIYLKSVRILKRIIKEFKPDIVHAHYASSYGFVGALTGFHPYYISVWGGDVFSFPNNSKIHHSILKYSLSKADRIFSTSKVMKTETNKYTNKNITVIPFGVDIEKFKPFEVERLFSNDDLIIGTIKSLEDRYGINYLIEAFSILKNKYPKYSLKLLIVGKGTKYNSLLKLTEKLGVKDDTVFVGFVSQDQIHNYHNMIDIFVAVSLEESFGVAIIEASACEKPVIVSDVGGLPEVVDSDKTGFIVKSKDITSIVNRISKLIENRELRATLGKNGRQKVLNEYQWNDCVLKMVNEYEKVIN